MINLQTELHVLIINEALPAKATLRNTLVDLYYVNDYIFMIILYYSYVIYNRIFILQALIAKSLKL